MGICGDCSILTVEFTSQSKGDRGCAPLNIPILRLKGRPILPDFELWSSLDWFVSTTIKITDCLYTFCTSV